MAPGRQLAAHQIFDNIQTDYRCLVLISAAVLRMSCFNYIDVLTADSPALFISFNFIALKHKIFNLL